CASLRAGSVLGARPAEARRCRRRLEPRHQLFPNKKTPGGGRQAFFFASPRDRSRRLAGWISKTRPILTSALQERFAIGLAIAEDAGEVVGFALFFHNYSTFLGRPGIYLEDLFVLPERRGEGHGKALLIALARLAFERGCGRLEWAVLDWNQPALDFYRALGAT